MFVFIYRLSNFFFLETTNNSDNINFLWNYRGLQGILYNKSNRKAKFYYVNDGRKLMFPDLIDICAPAHAFVIKDDLGTRQNIHEQFAKRAANVISLYRTNKGKRNWEQLDEKTLKFHLHEDQLASYEEVEDKVASLRNDVKEWKAAHANLEAEKNKLFDEI